MTGIIHNDDDLLLLLLFLYFYFFERERDDMHEKGGWEEGGCNFAHCERKRLQASLLISDGPWEGAQA